MLNRFLVSLLALAAVAGAARAADLDALPAVKEWSGFYIGAHGGFGGGDFGYPMTIYGPSINGLIGSNYDFGADLTSSGWFGGAQAGYNLEYAGWLVGLEADISASDIRGELRLYSDTANAEIAAGSSVDWFGTARLRAGFLATNDLLFYGTGGLAYGEATADFDLSDLSPGLKDSTSNMLVGWTIGAGFEYMLVDGVTLKTEYLYVDLGEADLLDIRDGNGDGLRVGSDTSFHTVRAGFNFLF